MDLQEGVRSMANKGALTSKAAYLRETETLILIVMAAQFFCINPRTLHSATATSSTTLWVLLGWQEQLTYTMGKPLSKAAISFPMEAQSLAERFCWIQLQLSLAAAGLPIIQQHNRVELSIRCKEAMLYSEGKDARSYTTLPTPTAAQCI